MGAHAWATILDDPMADHTFDEYVIVERPENLNRASRRLLGVEKKKPKKRGLKSRRKS